MLISDSVLEAAGRASALTSALSNALEPMTWDAMTPLISLRDCGAPYRGKWVVYYTSPRDYCAMHHLKAAVTEPAQTIEERMFAGDAEASLFVRHLLLHGWSVYEITDAFAASKVI